MPEKAENGLCGKLLQKLKAQVWPTKLVAEVDVIDIEGQLEDCSDRCQWDIIAEISPATIINVLYSALSKRHIAYRDLPITLVSQTRGSYHQVFIAKIRNPSSYQLEGWVIKIPGHGTPDRWKSEDQYMLFHEVQTMRLITTYTDMPVAEVIDYSATLDNGFGFPYIVMEELPGIPADNLWYEDHAVAPSPGTEQKRLNCLRSLAQHMTGLDKLRFDQIGMPMFNPHSGAFTNHQDIEGKRLPVGKYYVWPYCDSYQSVQRGPFTSTQHYIRDAFKNVDCLTNDGTEKLSRPGIKGSLDETKVQSIGTSKFLAVILSHPVFHSTPSSTFALRHPDLDLQNILTDGDGNVVGILDWDASLAAPRCVGHASVPGFLDLDFYPHALTKSPFLHWRAGHYRDIYAAALVEAGNPNAQYTSKSHIYQAVLLTMYDGNDKDDLFERLLRETGLQIDLWDAKYLLTKGCKATEEMLKKEIWKVLDPQLPAENLLQCVEQHNHVEATVLAWMEGFSQFSV